MGGLKDLNLTLADIENELLSRKLNVTTDIAIALADDTPDDDEEDDIEWDDD